MDKRLQLLSQKGITFNAEDTDLILSYVYWEILKDKTNRIRAVYTWASCKCIYLHRLLMQPALHEIVDHKDGNPLNNCRYNLRVTTQANNCLNRAPNKDKLLSKGVSIRPNGMYRARITVDGITYSLGDFTNELEAAKAYDKEAKILHGKYARINNHGH